MPFLYIIFISQEYLQKYIYSISINTEEELGSIWLILVLSAGTGANTFVRFKKESYMYIYIYIHIYIYKAFQTIFILV